MNEITITAITSQSAAYQKVWQLRELVLRQPLGMSLANEDLSADHSDTIMIAVAGDEVIGCIMLHHKSEGVVKFRQMAVHPAWQGKGIGKLVLDAAETQARAAGYSLVSLHARQVVADFYTKSGYIAEGAPFEEVGIPHLLMTKKL